MGEDEFESQRFRSEERTASSDPGALPDLVATYTDCGLYGLVVGTLLCLGALFTNSVPDPSFPWFSLPPSLQIPVTQPRVEHWPVSYTVGIWLWVSCLPAVFLRGYQRYVRGGSWSPTTWLIALPTLTMFALTTYCRFFWPKLYPSSWNAPSYTLVCWGYCSSYVPFWSNAAYVVATLGVVGTVLAVRGSRWAWASLIVFGVLSFPLGVPAVLLGLRRYSQREDGGSPVGSPSVSRA